MMQFNMYHHYTVDEHLLRSIGVLDRHRGGRLGDDHPLANKIVGTIRNRRALFVAMFLHDIAKGRPDDHSHAGRGDRAQSSGPRFGLSDAETETVAWLVEHHLLMSNTAQSRDLSDPATIKAFADVVQTMERLKLLLVLTIADIKAVGPGVWTGWKGQLLRTLYYETEIVLGGGAADIARSERVRLAQEELRGELPDWTGGAVRRLCGAPFARLLAEDRRRAPRQAGALRQRGRRRPDAPSTTTYETRSLPRRDGADDPVARPSAPARHRHRRLRGGRRQHRRRADLHDHRRHGARHDRALARLRPGRGRDCAGPSASRTPSSGRSRARCKIADLVDGKRPAPARPRPFHVPPEVTIDNSLSNRQTVIEVSGLDRPGLLYDLTTALGKLNLNIASAHIATFGEKAVDVFYVTDLTGTKITHAGRQARHPAGPAGGLQDGRKGGRRSAAALDLWAPGPDMWR